MFQSLTKILSDKNVSAKVHDCGVTLLGSVSIDLSDKLAVYFRQIRRWKNLKNKVEILHLE